MNGATAFATFGSADARPAQVRHDVGKVEFGPHAVHVWDRQAPGRRTVRQVTSEHGVGEAIKRLAVVRGLVLRALVCPELVEREYGVVVAVCVGERSCPRRSAVGTGAPASVVIRGVPA
jgi:hypothetical protein